MRGVRAAVFSFSFLLTSTLLLPDGALAQRRIGGHMGRPGHVGGQIGIRGRGFDGPRVFHHRGFHERRGFQGPMFRRRFDHFGSRGLPHRRFDFVTGFPDGGFFFGFPHSRFFFGFPHHHFFGLSRRHFFFGFPKHRLDFFGIPGPGHHFGFPRHRFFFGFPKHRLDFFGIPGPGHHFGFPRRRFGFFGPGWFPVGVGVPLAFDGVRGDRLRAFDSPYLGAPVTGQAGDTLPAAESKQVADPRVAVAGVGGAGDSLVVERVSVVDEVTRTGVRLTWKDAGEPAEEVTLFLADATRNVLAVQSVRAPLYSALFEPPPGTAFAGMTVMWPDGSASTRVVAYRPLGR
jgi:hypothetical protein